MKLAAVVIALEAVASAQPQSDVPPPVDAPVVAPGMTEPVATSPGHDMAVRMTTAARNAAALGKCARIDRLDTRVRELDAAYYEQVFATDPTIARCRPAIAPPGFSVTAQPGLVSVATPPPRRSITIEAGIGASALIAEGTPALRALGGPTLGIGSFVSPTLAVSVRLSGSLVVADGAFLYLGVLGPNAQVWQNDHVWLGSGLGLAILAGCGDGGCDHEIGFGFDARVGFAFRPRGQSGANLSVEAMHDWFAGADGGVTTVSVMLGYQSF